MFFSSFPRKTRRLIWTAIVGAFLIVFSLVFALVILPIIVEKLLSDNLVLKNGTEAWDRFMELPFPMDFKIYFFEVNNTEDVQNGESPILEEVGPFVYKNYRKKVDVEMLNDEYVSYYTLQTFEFDQELSELPEDYEITVLNFIAVGLFQILENGRIDFNYTIENLLPEVIGNSDLFHTVKVKDFLFGGASFCDPTTTYIPAKLICLVVMLLNVKMVKYEDNRSMTYSMFGHKQNAHDGKFVINTGVRDITKLGKVQSWNELKYTDIWQGEDSECNKVEGNDIGVFAPYLERDTKFDIYSTDICRVVTMEYQEDIKFRDIDVYKFGLNYNTWRPSNNCSADESCFCSNYTRGLDGEKSCFLDGVLDIHPCLGIPGMVSFPHFLHADPKYSDTVQNLHPSEDLHGSFMNIQPLTGAPLEGYISLQVNLILRRIRLGEKIVEITDKLGNISLPLLWLQQGVTITDEYYDIVSFAVTMLTAAEIGKWVFILISGLIFIYPIARILVKKS